MVGDECIEELAVFALDLLDVDVFGVLISLSDSSTREDISHIFPGS